MITVGLQAIAAPERGAIWDGGSWSLLTNPQWLPGLLFLFSFLKIFFFLKWAIFIVLIEFVTTLLVYFLGFWGQKAGEILAPWPGIKPAPPALEGSLNHQISKEVLSRGLYFFFNLFILIGG